MEKDDGGGAMDGELPTLSGSLTGVSLNFGKILAPPLPGATRAVVSRVSNRGCLRYAYRDDVSRIKLIMNKLFRQNRLWERRAA